MSGPPSFTDVSHPTLGVEWLMPSLNAILRSNAGVGSVDFQFWANSINDDETGLQFHASADFRKTEGFGCVNDDILDEIPQVRRIERLAYTLWHSLPLSCDGEGNINGEAEFHAEPGQILFHKLHYDIVDMEFLLECTHDGKVWQAVETLSVVNEAGISHSDLVLANSDHELLERIFEAATADTTISGKHKIISAKVDGDRIVFGLVPGEILKHHPTID